MDKMISKIYPVFLVGVFLFLMMATVRPSSANQADAARPSPDQLQYEPLFFELPKAHRVVLENGIILYILEDHDLPLVTINAFVKTGSMHDPAGKEGTAELTAQVMRTGGTTRLSSREIDRQFDLIAASASIAMAMESAHVGFSVLTTHLDKGLDLLSQILIHPVFEQGKLELARQLQLEEIRRIKDDPQKLAMREFSRLIYHQDPRGRFPSSASLTEIKRDDLTAFHSRFFLPNNIMFAVSGDITKEKAVEKIKQYFGGWNTKNSATDFPAPVQQPQTGMYFIEKDIPQSTIISGQFATGKNHPDFHAFTVLDFIVGSGGFPSRIMSTVRNNEGLAYSAGSFYRARPDYGIFGSYAFTKTSSTMKALSLINTVLENIKAVPVAGQELTWAQKSINDGFLFSFATPEQIVRQQMTIEYEKLPPDFLTSYREKINRVTVQDLHHAAVKYLDQTKNTVLILGDGKNPDHPLPPGGYTVIAPID